jgi:hypothetical protein
MVVKVDTNFPTPSISSMHRDQPKITTAIRELRELVYNILVK